MYQGTTPTIPIKIKGVDLSEAKIFLTFKDDRKNTLQTFETPDDFTVRFDGENTEGEIRLTQEQTLAFSSGNCTVQARWISRDGNAGASKTTQVTVNNVLLKGVIQYEQ